MNSKTLVVVAMSGGVDSSTSAAILKEQGYEVVGLTMILSDEIDNEGLLEGARSVARHLDIDLHTCDFRTEFKSQVINYFIQTYESGLTPNPCVICNRHIKFGRLLEEARKLGATYLSTGHYARLKKEQDQIKLFKGIDGRKDQSYFLYRLQQDQLKHLLFPLGELTKDKVRKLAADHGLPVADKEESQDLCFIGKGTYRDFLKINATVHAENGPIKDLQGNILGSHNGLWNYTVGQRRGLGISNLEPLYVVELDVKNNTLVVATDYQRGKNHLIAHSVNYIAGDIPADTFVAEIKIRYTAHNVKAAIRSLPNNRVMINMEKSLPDITPGQSVVFYNGDELIGGGFIEK